jgi:BirA family biotin operon repressor/biotin-[acetyl-CoA-carboxylase] ligase
LPIPDQLPVDFAEALERARPHLGRLGSEVFFFASVGSTSDVASTLAAHGDREGAVVVAEAQTAGRGRRGRTWFSPPSSGLYVSLVLTPGQARVTPDRAIALLTLAAGVALAEAVQLVAGLAVEIKWPNDLFLGRRKVAGILAEGVTRDAVVLGYGINVGPMAYPPQLSDRATSLELELGRPIDRASLFAETLAALARRYDDLLEGRFDAILDAWRARAPGSRGARVSWETPAGPRSGMTAGVDERGALVVDLGNRMERIVAGELKWL